MKKITPISILLFLLPLLNNPAFGQDYNLDKSLKGFDKYIEQVMDDWNTPGIGVGIVIRGKLAYRKGFGYRDLEKKLPVTSRTLFPIASNTKLFTAVAMGMLVHEGKLAWDESDFSRKELFDRLVYLEPVQAIRQSSLYSNLMYAASGYCLELIEGITWEEFMNKGEFYGRVLISPGILK